MANSAQDIDFDEKLDLVSTGKTGRDAYKKLIVTLRDKLIGSKYFRDNPKSPLAHTWYSHNLPVLRPELKVEDPKLAAKAVPWFELVVETPQHNSVTFKLRRDNLYVVGYQVHRTTGNDQWREFQPDEKDGKTLPSLIPNSILLPFRGGYPSLEGFLKRFNITLGNTLIGQQSLINAVDDLVPTTTTDEVRAQSLIVVIFMISESTRFRYVSDFIATNYLLSVRVDSDKVYDMTKLRKDWKKLSAALLRVDAGEKFYITEPHYERIKKEQDAVALLGILKYKSYVPEKKRKIPRATESNATSTSTFPVPFSTA